MLGIYAGATFDDLVAAVVSYNAELNKSHRISERRPKRICIVCSSGKEKCGFKAYASLNVENDGIQITQFEPHTCKEPCKRARQVRTKVLAAVVPGIREIVPTRDTNGEIAREIREMVRKQTGVELTKSQLNKIKAERKRKYEAEQKAEKLVVASIPNQIVQQHSPPPPPIVAAQVVSAPSQIASAAPLLQPDASITTATVAPPPPITSNIAQSVAPSITPPPTTTVSPPPPPVVTATAQQLPPGTDQLMVHPLPQALPVLVPHDADVGPTTDGNDVKRQKIMKDEGLTTIVTTPDKEFDPMLETWEARGVSADIVRPLKSNELAACLAAYLVSYDVKMTGACQVIEETLSVLFADAFISGAVFVEAHLIDASEVITMVMDKLKDIENIGAQVGIKVRLRSFFKKCYPFTN